MTGRALKERVTRAAGLRRKEIRDLDPFRPSHYFRATQTRDSPLNVPQARSGGYKRSGSRGQELLDRRLERNFAVTVVLPWLASCQQGGSGFHREALGIKARAHLAPVQRHRDRSRPARMRGERGATAVDIRSLRR